MSLFGGLFGKKKEGGAPPPPTAPTPPAPGPSGGANTAHGAIAKAKEQIEMQEKRRDYLDRKMDAELKKARAFQSQNKKADAIMCMKRRKLLEGQKQVVEKTIMNFEAQMMSLEGTIQAKQAVETTQMMNQALKKEVDDMGGADKAAEIYDEAEEAMQDAKEVQDVLTREMDTGVDMGDDEDLLAELDALGEDQAGADLLADLTKDVKINAPSVPTNVPMPSAPTTQMSADDEELAKLEREMAMG